MTNLFLHENIKSSIEFGKTSFIFRKKSQPLYKKFGSEILDFASILSLVLNIQHSKTP